MAAPKKQPKGLRALIGENSPENPPLVTGKGIAGAALEVGHGQSAIMSISNEGPSKQVSMTVPLGTPPRVRLAPEPEDTAPPSRFDQAWGQITASAPTAPQTMPTEAENPFEDAESEPDPEVDEPPNDTLEVSGIDLSSPAEEEAELAPLQEENENLKIALKTAQDELEAARAALASPSHQNGALPTWEGKDLRICFPCYKTTNPGTAFVLLALALDFGRDRIGFLPGLGDARIANTRNRLADDFLKTGATWCLMLDDDMIPTIGRPGLIRNFIGASAEEVPDKVLAVHVVDRLLKSGQKLIGATYFGRRKYSPAMFEGGINNPQAYNAAKKVSGHILKTDWVATGCILIHKDVFEGIKKACPELAPTSGRPFWDFFREGQGQSEGEDVMFCARARKAGFQPMVDTGAQCFHVGFCAWGFHNTTNVVPAAPRSQTAGWPGPR
jgi:hypothetical protein